MGLFRDHFHWRSFVSWPPWTISVLIGVAAALRVSHQSLLAAVSLGVAALLGIGKSIYIAYSAPVEYSRANRVVFATVCSVVVALVAAAVIAGIGDSDAPQDSRQGDSTLNARKPPPAPSGTAPSDSAGPGRTPSTTEPSSEIPKVAANSETSREHGKSQTPPTRRIQPSNSAESPTVPSRPTARPAFVNFDAFNARKPAVLFRDENTKQIEMSLTNNVAAQLDGFGALFTEEFVSSNNFERAAHGDPSAIKGVGITSTAASKIILGTRSLSVGSPFSYAGHIRSAVNACVSFVIYDSAAEFTFKSYDKCTSFSVSDEKNAAREAARQLAEIVVQAISSEAR